VDITPGLVSEEVPFLQLDRPWERAALIVAGTSRLPVSPDKIAIAKPPSPSKRVSVWMWSNAPIYLNAC
jgi:hypothetical protein